MTTEAGRLVFAGLLTNQVSTCEMRVCWMVKYLQANDICSMFNFAFVRFYGSDWLVMCAGYNWAIPDCVTWFARRSTTKPTSPQPIQHDCVIAILLLSCHYHCVLIQFQTFASEYNAGNHAWIKRCSNSSIEWVVFIFRPSNTPPRFPPQMELPMAVS